MKITIWDNDLTEDIEIDVYNYVKRHFTHADVNHLSGLSKRSPDDIIESVNGVVAVVAKLNLIDPPQVRSLAILLGKRIFGRVAGEDLNDFILLTHDPLNDAKTVAESCMTPWTEEADDPRNGLTGILQRCDVKFINPLDEIDAYKLESTGWANRTFDIVKLEA